MTIPLTKKTGNLGERLAARYLAQKGFAILAMNYQNTTGRRLGEIDIVAQDGKELVFAEVKTRVGEKYFASAPEENITRQKLRRLTRIAHCFLLEHKLMGEPYRFDAVSVWLDLSQKRARIKHIRSL